MAPIIMLDSGRLHQSVLQLRVSRSCSQTIASRATLAWERMIRESMTTCSENSGLSLWGMVLLPM